MFSLHATPCQLHELMAPGNHLTNYTLSPPKSKRHLPHDFCLNLSISSSYWSLSEARVHRAIVCTFKLGTKHWRWKEHVLSACRPSIYLGRVFSEYFGCPCQSSFHQILHHHNHHRQATIGQSVAAVPSGSSWTLPPTKRILIFFFLQNKK
jgi:hypothetical protein